MASLLPWAKLAKRSKSRLNRSEYNRAETVEETAKLVTRLGGTGLATLCDVKTPRCYGCPVDAGDGEKQKSASIDARRFQSGDNV